MEGSEHQIIHAIAHPKGQRARRVQNRKGTALGIVPEDFDKIFMVKKGRDDDDSTPYAESSSAEDASAAATTAPDSVQAVGNKTPMLQQQTLFYRKRFMPRSRRLLGWASNQEVLPEHHQQEEPFREAFLPRVDLLLFASCCCIAAACVVARRLKKGKVAYVTDDDSNAPLGTVL